LVQLSEDVQTKESEMADSTNRGLITRAYLEVQREAHKNDDYGISGHKWAEYIKRFGIDDILDYGCGKRTLEKALGFPIHNYDPAIEAFSAMPEPAQMVVCGDVLEHVEPECLDSVLAHLVELTIEYGFFVIGTHKAKRILSDGRNAHILLRSPEWWRNELSQYFDIIEAIEGNGEFVVFVRSKE